MTFQMNIRKVSRFFLSKFQVQVNKQSMKYNAIFLIFAILINQVLSCCQNPIGCSIKGSRSLYEICNNGHDIRTKCSGDNIFNEQFGCVPAIIESNKTALVDPSITAGENQAIPATSVHFYYDKPEQVETNSKNWNITQKIIVEASSQNTYFMTIGFSPGGYSGIQERPNSKFAIFSLWNDKTNSAELVSTGKTAKTKKFGGEGTGLKTIMKFNWKIGVPVEFRVEGWLEENTENTWHVACWVRKQTENSDTWSEWIFMAEYKRIGRQILKDWGYYSFIEDWDRKVGSTGHKIQRKAAFGQSTWNGEKITRFKFKKTDNPKTLDYLARWKAFAEGSPADDGMAKLSTGGDILMNGPIIQEKNEYIDL